MAYRMGENLCQLHIWQWINIQKLQGAQKVKLPKNQKPMKKWANEPGQIFFKERGPNDQ
jgi:hypothetical protein